MIPLHIDRLARRVTRGGQEIYLRRAEYAILCYMEENADVALTRRQIYEAVWEEEFGSGYSRTVDVHISRLRKALGPGYITTLSGWGYRWDGATPAVAHCQ